VLLAHHTNSSELLHKRLSAIPISVWKDEMPTIDVVLSVWRSGSRNRKKTETEPNRTAVRLFCGCGCPHLLIPSVTVALIWIIIESRLKPVLTGSNRPWSTYYTWSKYI
jgi:hypothetical protein